MKVSSKGKSSQWRRPQLLSTDHQPDVVGEGACSYGVHIFLAVVNGLKLVMVRGLERSRSEDGDKMYRFFSIPTTEDTLHDKMNRYLRSASFCS